MSRSYCNLDMVVLWFGAWCKPLYDLSKQKQRLAASHISYNATNLIFVNPLVVHTPDTQFVKQALCDRFVSRREALITPLTFLWHRGLIFSDLPKLDLRHFLKWSSASLEWWAKMDVPSYPLSFVYLHDEYHWLIRVRNQHISQSYHFNRLMFSSVHHIFTVMTDVHDSGL